MPSRHPHRVAHLQTGNLCGYSSVSHSGPTCDVTHMIKFTSLSTPQFFPASEFKGQVLVHKGGDCGNEANILLSLYVYHTYMLHVILCHNQAITCCIIASFPGFLSGRSKVIRELIACGWVTWEQSYNYMQVRWLCMYNVTVCIKGAIADIDTVVAVLNLSRLSEYM